MGLSSLSIWRNWVFFSFLAFLLLLMYLTLVPFELVSTSLDTLVLAGMKIAAPPSNREMITTVTVMAKIVASKSWFESADPWDIWLVWRKLLWPRTIWTFLESMREALVGI